MRLRIIHLNVIRIYAHVMWANVIERPDAWSHNYAKMKILVVCQYFYPESFSINDVVKGFVDAGHDVFVVTGQPNYGYEKIMDGYEDVVDETIFGARVHRCALKPRKKGRFSIIENYLSFWSTSKKYLRKLKEEFDVVYSMSLSPLTAIVGGTVYARKHHIRHVLHCLDLWPESTVVTGAVRKDSLVYRILFRWCKAIYSKLDEILISSPSFEAYFRQTLKVNRVPISYVPQPPQTALPSETVSYEHPFNFVYAGNIGTLQLVEQLVLAVDLIKNQADVHLHLIGMGARSDAVMALIKERGLEDQVSFYGVKPRCVTASYYEKATGIIVSLIHAGTVGKTIPAKLTTALYYGKPILAVLGGDGRALLEESGGGVFAKGETPEDIAEAMMTLVSMGEEERSKLGQKNKFYFDSHYDNAKIVADIIDHLSRK